jgi:hypothetical protein
MGKLLFDESPLVVQPSLAKAIGLNEAIVLQQINYWLNQKGIGKTIRGERWIYNTVADWQKNFPFWSQETIKRTIYSLQDAQLIKSGTYNQSPTDRTKWYTINFAVVELLEALIQQEKDLADEALNDATGQNDTMGVTECYDIPESTSEITEKQKEAVKPKVNAYAAYNSAFGEPIPNPTSPRTINAVEDLEEYPQDWLNEAFLRTSKRERSAGERWKDYQRFPYALSILNEWKHAGKILPEATPKPQSTYQRPKPGIGRASPPRAEAGPITPDEKEAKLREWVAARTKAGMDVPEKLRYLQVAA